MLRRSFLATSVGVAALAGELPRALAAAADAEPLVISTWDHGIAANAAALKTLASGGSVVDAVEHGVMVTEADPTNLSVGLSGLPDRDGIVTLDACIMSGDGRAGSACFLQGIKHPVSLARMVMDTTPHVMIVGAGAERFARENGMKQLPNDLSEAARKAWQEWVKEKNYKPVINIENHDTIGLLARDAKGRMAGACTTSGLAYKIHGRVGDSPIIGAGLFVDDEVGGATCTGLGESVIRTSASTVAVERMRYGATPQEACEEAIRRIVKKHPNWKEFQVGILAVDKNGRHGAYALQKGFTYALNQTLKTAESYS
ncbi:MAG: hypothetical protein RIR53_1333 [Bacteroidota bacterium]|jgi:N4-(beta-N-acetylglucosaminyl)-L-asparaginase